MALVYTKISSNYTRKRNKGATLEDIAARKAKRSHKKRHAVKAEIAHFNARKKADRKKYMAKVKSTLAAFHEAVRSYWRNEADTHPGRPSLPPKPRYDLPAKTRTSYK
jgi:hypothetical protein